MNDTRAYSRRMRRAGLGWLLVVGVACASVAMGCGTSRRGEPVAAPVPVESNATASGQQVFMNKCHQCHPGGSAGLGPALNDKPLPGFLIKHQVRSGMGAMPKFPKEAISDEELNHLVAYMKTLRRAEKPKG